MHVIEPTAVRVPPLLNESVLAGASDQDLSAHGESRCRDGRGAFLTELGYEIPEDLQAADEGSFFMDLSPENYSLLDELDVLYILEYEGQEDEVRNNEAFKNLDIVQDDKVRFVPQEVGNAMSMPNPVTIPWALDNFDA